MGGDWPYPYHLQTTVVLFKLLVFTKCNNFLVDPSSSVNFAMRAEVGTSLNLFLLNIGKFSSSCSMIPRNLVSHAFILIL